MRNAVLSLALLAVVFGVFSFRNPAPGKAPEASAINWLTWEQALEKSKTQKRKFLVDIYTDWCHWCKQMDASTFGQPQIAKYVNANFYAVKFNAEQKDDITFKGKTYKFVKQGMKGYHELAAEITRGQLTYPTIVFLDENLDVLQPIPGFRKPLEFEQIITYFGKNEHQRTPWETYQRTYKPMARE